MANHIAYKRETHQEIIRLLNKKRSLQLPFPVSNSINKSIKSYLADCEIKNLSNSTIRAYQCYLGRFQKFTNKNGLKNVNQIDRSIVREFLGQISNLTPNLRHRIITILRGYGNFLARNEVIPSTANWLLMDLPKLQRPLPNVLSVNEVCKIINAPLIRLLRDWALLETFYSTGCRVSEVLNMENKDLNLSDGSAVVTGKGSKQRIVFINRRANLAISTYNKTKKKEDLLPECKVFLTVAGSGEGKKLHKARVGLQMKQYALMEKVNKRVHPHLFRHAFATHLLEGGANTLEIKELLGHSCISTTEVYTHVSPQKMFADHALLFGGKDVLRQKQEDEITEGYEKIRKSLGVQDDSEFVTEKDVAILERRVAWLKEQVAGRKQRLNEAKKKTTADILREAAEERAKDPYLTFAEAAKYIKTSVMTLKDWVKKGYLSKVRNDGIAKELSKNEIDLILQAKPEWLIKFYANQKRTQNVSKDHISVEEAGKILGISLTTAHKYVKQGLIKSDSTRARNQVILSDVQEIIKNPPAWLIKSRRYFNPIKEEK